MRTSGDQVRAATARRVAELAADLGQEPRRPIVVPEPGRHAARRSSAPRVLGTVLGPAHLAVLVLVVAAGVALTAWWVVRDQSRQVVEPPAPATAAPLVEESPGGGAAVVPNQGATGTATGVATVTVDVSGKVRRPGIVVLDAGARVVDAVEQAGGARPGVDLSGLNLARVLVDGEQIVVGAAPPVAVPPQSGATSGPAVPVAPVNLNTATQAELETLPDVGPVTALAIVSWREEHGGFTSVDELLEVDGIGEATLANLSPYVTV